MSSKLIAPGRNIYSISRSHSYSSAFTVLASKTYRGVRLPNIMPPRTRIPLPRNLSIFYEGGMKTRSSFSPDEDSKRITLSEEFQLITGNSMPHTCNVHN
ncbi:hypothetical protein TNCV_1203961 [Trichonephila clavipes]|nr:hypothetical protein TNCV_1203961 [Trichonephila clavipes]